MDCYQGSSSYQPNSDGIPIDLFVSKKKPHNNKIITSNFKFTDSFGNLVFTVDRLSGSTFDHHQFPVFKRLIADSSGNPLISIAHNQKTTWHGFKKNGNEENDVMFKAVRTTNTFTKVEFQVFLNNEKSNFKMRGSPFYRSCTIYNGDSIVAQTSLMYKLGIQNVLVPRNRFRLTIFPGYADHAFIVSLTVIFFYGRKLWI